LRALNRLAAICKSGKLVKLASKLTVSYNPFFLHSLVISKFLSTLYTNLLKRKFFFRETFFKNLKLSFLFLFIRMFFKKTSLFFANFVLTCRATFGEFLTLAAVFNKGGYIMLGSIKLRERGVSYY